MTNPFVDCHCNTRAMKGGYDIEFNKKGKKKGEKKELYIERTCNTIMFVYE